MSIGLSAKKDNKSCCLLLKLRALNSNPEIVLGGTCSCRLEYAVSDDSNWSSAVLLSKTLRNEASLQEANGKDAAEVHPEQIQSMVLEMSNVY